MEMAWLFIVTPTGFFFDFCSDLENDGKLTPLSPEIVSLEVQSKYLELITTFIK